MDRHDFEQKLADYLGHELNPHARADFETYLKAHPDAQEEVESLRAVLKGLDRLTPPPLATHEKVARDYERPRPRTGVLLKLRRALAYAAVLVAGVAIGWMARPLPEPSATSDGGGAIERIIRPGRRVPDFLPQNRFARNCLALSLAFSQPIASPSGDAPRDGSKISR